MVKLTPKEKLLKKREQLEERLQKERERGNQKFANIGWGCGMRGYKKLSVLSYRKEDELRERLRVINIELEALN